MHTQDLTELGDEQLADAVRAGRAEAFAVLWERHADAGRAAARRLTATYDPDDLVQEAYLRVLGALQSGHGPTGPFRPYLYTTLRSVAASWARTPDPTPVEDVPEVVDPRDLSTEVLERSVTVRAFRRLPERWQAVLWYTEVEGMEPREAAPLLGLSASATAALSYRAREGLRREWLQAHVSSDAVAPECRWTVERLGDHARGTLSRAAQDRVEEHLTGCLSCSILAEEVDDVASRLRIVLLPLVLGLPAAVDAATGALAATAAAPGTTGPATGATTGPATGATGGGPAWPAPGTGARAAASGAAVPGVLVGALAAVVVAAVVGVLAVARPWSAAEPPAAAAGQQSSAPGLAAPLPVLPDGDPAENGADDVPLATEPDAPGGAGDRPEPPAAGVDAPPAPRPDGQDAPGAGETVPEPAPPSVEPATPAPPEPEQPGPEQPAPEEPGPEEPAPPAPVVDEAPPAGTLTVYPALRGSGEPGASVRALDATGAVVGTTTVASDGRWALVATGLGAAGEHVLDVVQDVDGVVSASAAPLGPYVFDLPRVLSPGPGETVLGARETAPWEDPRFSVLVTFAGAAGLVVEAFVDGRSTGNLHELGDEPAVRQVHGLAPGPHTFGIRFVEPASDAAGFGPTVSVGFTVAGP
ncbi:RNA polymerase sigma factor, sigma-70 family [Cellulosimicrobium aquatile]|uniref:RNA polymerase sigma factor, sigma-70 family n=1 Tax=Cellulosimicrobium aquatile TaxID=1612203 RepID=A0A1N6NWW3_9MICO|nr:MULTISPECIES: sigma-70 family RNA polymerase sigma factor [Cellulosimicrobium]MCM3535300.1 sigma-70 family RNA polymerase sigma factor [Cellulosimicrobium funkei]SIP96589.1 RNA polymerase sigma factor, sigma-70 family [Cellulosimicrobium aquatile]